MVFTSLWSNRHIEPGGKEGTCSGGSETRSSSDLGGCWLPQRPWLPERRFHSLSSHTSGCVVCPFAGTIPAADWVFAGAVVLWWEQDLLLLVVGVNPLWLLKL